jgi:hypothetical protein
MVLLYFCSSTSSIELVRRRSNSRFFADVTAFKAMPVDLPQGSDLYADSGHTCCELEDLFGGCERLGLKVCRETSSKRNDEPHMACLKNHFRKRTETTLSGITDLFPRRSTPSLPKGSSSS